MNQSGFPGGAGGRSARDNEEKFSWEINTYDGEVGQSGGQGTRDAGSPKSLVMLHLRQ